MLGCEHYNRGCKFIAPCCNKEYWFWIHAATFYERECDTSQGSNTVLELVFL